MNNMTPAQYKVYLAIKSFIDKKGYPPTVRELCKITGKSSPATIQVHLVNLKKKKIIDFKNNRSRTITIL